MLDIKRLVNFTLCSIYLLSKISRIKVFFIQKISHMRLVEVMNDAERER